LNQLNPFMSFQVRFTVTASPPVCTAESAHIT
jgi:hypothetical protein